MIRKQFGYVHIPNTTHNAYHLNSFCINHLNTYLNYHRPCGFVTTKIDRRGKEKKVYDTYLTPYEKFCTLENPEQYLKDTITLDSLEGIAQAMSDTQFAIQMKKEKKKTFEKLQL